MKQLTASRQKGIALISVMIAILIMTVLAVLGSGKLVQKVNDAAAESTGAYLLHVRSAVLNSLSLYHHAFTNIDISSAPPGTYSPSPTWASFAGTTTRISVEDLKDAELLRDDFPDRPPMGRSAHIHFVREGSCPGHTCEVKAFIYTCWPITTARPSGAIDINTCPNPPGGLEDDSDLTGSALMATEGLGGSNSIDPGVFKGPLFAINTADLGLPASSRGHVAVLASLNDTLLNQFVRQGDNRHIFLNNNLTTEGFVQTNTGLLLNTAAVIDASCDAEDMYATTDNKALAMCKGGRWFALTNHMVMGSGSYSSGANVPVPACPGPNLEPFFIASVLSSDVRMSGSDIDVHGTQSGTFTGGGSVSQYGGVSVSGTFTGTFQSQASSFINVAQRAEVDASGLVTITPNGSEARASVISGCRII